MKYSKNKDTLKNMLLLQIVNIMILTDHLNRSVSFNYLILLEFVNELSFEIFKKCSKTRSSSSLNSLIVVLMAVFLLNWFALENVVKSGNRKGKCLVNKEIYDNQFNKFTHI